MKHLLGWSTDLNDTVFIFLCRKGEDVCYIETKGKMYCRDCNFMIKCDISRSHFENYVLFSPLCPTCKDKYFCLFVDLRKENVQSANINNWGSV